MFVQPGARLGALRPATLRARARRLLAALRRGPWELNVVLCGDVEMRRLNRTHRGADRPTDVLAFPMGSARALGDVVLDTDAVRRQARDRGGWARAHAAARPGAGWDALAEATMLLVHGVLHLCGHDHHRPADARRMLRRERALFAQLHRGDGSRSRSRSRSRRASAGDGYR
ncbi:MAG TPA: rRNA maturation RNase YbeY [Myxococcota bacterium]|nr:rRNA maturation RNase YbeY [Myxococcota bacterium]